jgi:hypothetical protein
MPSVDVVWKGRCVNRQDQQELCEHLLRLAERSNRKFMSFFGEQVQTACLNVPKGKLNYLISSRVFGNETPPARIKAVEDGVYLSEGLSLYGVEFPLYDPRNFTPPFGLGTSNRVSFVFIRSDEPGLDGRLVQIYPVHKGHRLSAFSQMVLVNPVVDLRYYLEGWMGKFLGWVKHFYMPDLYYWIWEDYPGYDAYRGKVSKDRVTAEQHFDRLLEAFSEEAESFTEEIEVYRQKREAQGEDVEIKPEGETR